MAVAWDTQMSPVDVRSLKVKQFTPMDGGGACLGDAMRSTAGVTVGR